MTGLHQSGQTGSVRSAEQQIHPAMFIVRRARSVLTMPTSPCLIQSGFAGWSLSERR